MTDVNQVRINELARELEVKAKAIIDLLPGYGVTEKKTHSSSIPADVAEKVRKNILGHAEEEAKAEAAAKAEKEAKEAAAKAARMRPPAPPPASPQASVTPAATKPVDVGCPDASWRGRGKIACLPKKVRDHINQMLEDGVRYVQIKENLGDHGKDLTLDNISQWKKRGHQLWLKEQFWREEMRARMDAFTDLLGNGDPAQLPIVGLQMSLTQLCEQLRDLGPVSP